MNIDYAIVASFERAKGTHERKPFGNVFTLLLMAFFFIVLMLCLTTGVRIFQGVSAAHAQADALHMQSGLIANIVRINDTADAIEVGEGPEGPALVFVERLESGTFETRIYRSNGAIVQEYAISGRPYKPENAIRIIDSSVFSIGFQGGLVSIQTDEGIVEVAVRSEQSAEEFATNSAIAGGGQ